jgi:hypothetical protein
MTSLLNCCRGWCSLTLLLGYGAIRPLRQLIKAAKRSAEAGAAASTESKES